MLAASLSRGAKKIQQALAEKGLTLQVFELPDSTHTAVDAAKAIGCEEKQIVKSLLFRTEKTQAPVFVLASGPNQVDLELISAQVGETVIKADAKFTKNTTGFSIGGVPPFAHKERAPYQFIDQALLNCDSIWAAAGSPRAVFNLNTEILLELCPNAKPIDFNPEAAATLRR